MIGVLKALGATDASIRAVFMRLGFRVTAMGLFGRECCQPVADMASRQFPYNAFGSCVVLSEPCACDGLFVRLVVVECRYYCRGFCYHAYSHCHNQPSIAGETSAV